MTTFSRTRNHVSRIYSGPRLATMILLLGVVGIIMFNARNPRNWKWLENLSPEPAAATAQSLPPAEKKPGEENKAEQENQAEPKIRYDATSKDYDPSTVQPDNPKNANFHWDKDPEALDEFEYNKQVITDNTLFIQPEEMHGYRRLLTWVKTRAFQDLLKASTTKWSFNDLIQEPQKHRGELLELPLRVVRIIPYHDFVLDPSTKEERTIYEVWGRSYKKSGQMLYFAIVPELPEGMPVGDFIDERVTLVGYFYKLHGYLEKEASPRSKPVKAPMIIGRLAWEPKSKESTPPSPQFEWKQEWTWWGLGTLFVGYLALRWWLTSAAKKPSLSEQQLETKDAALIGDWLEHPDTSALAEQEPGADQADQVSPQIDPNFTNSSKGSKA